MADVADAPVVERPAVDLAPVSRLSALDVAVADPALRLLGRLFPEVDTLLKFEPLTIASMPPPGRHCLVVGSLSDWPGPERYDVGVMSVDGDGVVFWLGCRNRCEVKVGGPAVTRFAVLPPLEGQG